ncbi:Transmembrane 9 superfamily member 4 [Geodia barretti]|nr:Transmembrane 9 superfamily member 4 [Geodia barretti]
MLALLCMWFGTSFPLVFRGSYFGFRKQPYEHPVRTNQIPRQIPEQVWYLHPVSASSGMTETNDITITSQDTLQSLLSRVGLTEHMELFQSNEIDLEALLLMSDKDFSEIGLPQAAQTTLMNSLGRRTPSAVREEGVASSAADQGDGRGFPSGSRQQEDSL